jgi:hypothetical protein
MLSNLQGVEPTVETSEPMQSFLWNRHAGLRVNDLEDLLLERVDVAVLIMRGP